MIMMNQMYCDWEFIILLSNTQCLGSRFGSRRFLGRANSVLSMFAKMFKDRKTYLKLRISLLKCYVWSTFLYCCEAWLLIADMMEELEYQKVVLQSYVEHIMKRENHT